MRPDKAPKLTLADLAELDMAQRLRRQFPAPKHSGWLGAFGRWLDRAAPDRGRPPENPSRPAEP